MARRNFHKRLIASDDFAQYSLRATFFVRKLRSMKLWEAIHEVYQLSKAPKGFPWEDRRAWGIEEDAWDYVTGKKINPLLIFCHPRALGEQPRLLLYYRTVNLISQKGLATLVGSNIAAIESGKVLKLDRQWITEVVIALNSIASAVIKNSAEIGLEDLAGFQFATAGATIQGSWNNAIGAEGEAAVRTILVNHLRDEILQLVWRDGSSSDYEPLQHTSFIDRIDELRVLRLKSGYHIRFGSEPDISMRDPKDTPVVAVEVKAGTDPAGALERLGAAMKSFENDRDLNPRVKTVYVVRCITPELQKRINEGAFFDHTFALSDLLVNETRQKGFANLFVRVIVKKRRQ
ncbi:XcyI family restriction endonuclease [Candidatus Parcubacteria bacterium]|nr:MAG: XcyI family restriction endonuclease [Candidatus Parcubacteria bacterium]